MSKRASKKLRVRLTIGPIALKVGQKTASAPEHDRWCTVTCEKCGEQFDISHNRKFTTITEAEAVKRFEDILAEDHNGNYPHQDFREIPS
jgi:hypothetical protein